MEGGEEAALHPLDRIRQLASYALAALLVINAAFCFAMLMLAIFNIARGSEYSVHDLALFAGLLATFSAAAWFFWWYGREAGR